MSHGVSAGTPGDKERSALTGVVAGLVDTGVTLGAMLAAHSSVLVADVLKTFLEFVAVLLAWLAIRRINSGRAYNYNYGLGKLENLSSLFVGVIMVLCLLVIVVNATRNILHPAHISGVGVWISLVSQVVYAGINGGLMVKNQRLARQSESPILTAQVGLFRAKMLANLFILGSLGSSLALARFGWAVYIDPVASLLIGLSILLAAIGIFSHSFRGLLDCTLEETQQIFILRQLAQHFEEYEGLHGIRSRRSGSRVYVEIFLEYAPDKKVAEVMASIERIRSDIETQLPESSVTIALADKPAPE